MIVVLTGSERCPFCIGRDIGCVVNLAAIRKWSEDCKAGKEFTRTPTGVPCLGCRGKKNKCLLPRTAAMRAMVKKRRKDEVDEAKESDADRASDAKESDTDRASESVDESSEDSDSFDSEGQLLVELTQQIRRQQARSGTHFARIANELERILDMMEETEPLPADESEDASGTTDDCMEE